ncbi:MAG TPA: bifunctional demethylmenaquinone methyltransferase/2-methoxy-6-polyprenyl-1,4-benzoquinol methylase UbiE [Lacipirellulaceae bacterium]|nr:bifunctional demethylmenaquinone methyltransferase/2-methoxy-6-polyprenyl-1,4-benzoquinol methylase UbiE [Lacipirellulaceae bacterium]
MPHDVAVSPPPIAVDKSGPRVRRMFGEIAGRYDLLNHLLSLNVDRYWRRRTVRLAPPRPGTKILDVCTGTGDLALAYDRAAGGTVQIFAAGFCREMVGVGPRKGQAAGAHQRITFVEADAQRLPTASDQFDVVCVAFGLRNVANTDAGLAEMVRVCAPGGRVAVLEFSMPQTRPLKAIYGWYFRRALPRIGQWLARNRESAYSYLPASVGEFPQGEALAERMQAAGLSDVWRRGLTLGVATIYVGTKPGGTAEANGRP